MLLLFEFVAMVMVMVMVNKLQILKIFTPTPIKRSLSILWTTDHSYIVFTEDVNTNAEVGESYVLEHFRCYCFGESVMFCVATLSAAVSLSPSTERREEKERGAPHFKLGRLPL